jgi:hypothetical protein
MNCAICEKSLKGGFKQANGDFWCAKCVIRDSEVQSLREMIGVALRDVESMLDPKARPVKWKLKHVRSVLKACVTKPAL